MNIVQAVRSAVKRTGESARAAVKRLGNGVKAVAVAVGFAVGVTVVSAPVPVLAAEDPTYTSPIASVLEAFPVDTITADMTAFVTSNLGLSLIFVISGVVLVLIRRAFRG